MKNLFVLSFVLFSMFNLQSVFAASVFDAGTVNSKAVLDMKLHEAVSRTRDKNEIIKKEKENEIDRNKTIETVNQTALTDIKYVTFMNNASIPSRELFTVIQSYINQPMTPLNVSAIRKEIMRYYQKKGYYSALASVTSENSQTGELVLEIKEGGKNSITVEPSF